MIKEKFRQRFKIPAAVLSLQRQLDLCIARHEDKSPPKGRI